MRCHTTILPLFGRSTMKLWHTLKEKKNHLWVRRNIRIFARTQKRVDIGCYHNTLPKLSNNGTLLLFSINYRDILSKITIGAGRNLQKNAKCWLEIQFLKFDAVFNFILGLYCKNSAPKVWPPFPFHPHVFKLAPYVRPLFRVGLEWGFNLVLRNWFSAKSTDSAYFTVSCLIH